MRGGALAEAIHAVQADDMARVRHLLADSSVSSGINQPIGSFDSPAIIHVKSRGLLDLLLEAGADINARSNWWAGGFGLLDWAPPDVARYAIERGATVTIHAAARLSLIDELKTLLAKDPALVHARGGDGQTPLHMAATVEVADLLIAAGADLNTRDVDHESTAAQYMVGERQPVARHLVTTGCTTDLLMASALGDLDRARRHLDANPQCVRMRVDDDWFPMANPKAGGTIYNWTLGFYASAHEVAKRYERADVLQLLFDHTPAAARVVEACWVEDEAAVARFRQDKADVNIELDDSERTLIAHAARNNKTAAVRLMLECGLPVGTPGQHRGTPLHWAAFHGNADMVREILRFKPALDDTANDFNGTPVGWAIYGSEHGWYARTGDYPRVVELLLDAGAKRPDAFAGSAAVREVLQRL